MTTTCGELPPASAIQLSRPVKLQNNLENPRDSIKMERSRDYLPVRIGTWNKRNFLSFCALVLVCLITTFAVGLLQSQTIPYFLTKDPTGNSGTDYDILNSKCRVDEYGSSINDVNCFSHYFKIDDFFTQYFSVDGAFKVKDSYIQDGTVLPLSMKLTWLGRKSEKGTCKSDGCTSCLKLNPEDPAECLKTKSKAPCARCNVKCYRCIRSLGMSCGDTSTGGSSGIVKPAADKIQSVCGASEENGKYDNLDVN